MLKSIVIVVISLFASLVLAQKWEQIGWKGTGDIPVIRTQVGEVLYGVYNSAFYISNDWGKNWTVQRNGLPDSRKIYGSKMFEKNGMALLYLPERLPYTSIVPNGYYYHNGVDSTWQVRAFTPIDRPDWHIYDLRSLHYFSEDSVAILYSDGPQGDRTTYGVYVSTTGGDSWQKRVAGIHEGVGSNFRRLEKQGSRLILYTAEQDTGIRTKNLFYKSDNFGASWEKVNIPLPDSVWGEGYLDASVQVAVMAAMFSEPSVRSAPAALV